MRGEQDAMDLMDAYDATIDRYETAFGNSPWVFGGRRSLPSVDARRASHRNVGRE
jgi:hypothetical protein